MFQREGNYPAPAGVPADILGLEIAGIIVACGPQVTNFKVGDRVCALLAGGGYAEFACLATSRIKKAPTCDLSDISL
ncbi:MAG: alcohol dehydrogenase catalytic domain-containing protein [Sphingobacterium sp.]|uniref:alcohol dehydrogenase catalytic domain-containing protein n=1 Tax=Sphingobacterium TaxID=28453 RepID=UPI001F346F8B|nr:MULTISPECIES: alcohol dehydrogenase catalytic domain-containing protein [Sphingobacterium]